MSFKTLQKRILYCRYTRSRYLWIITGRQTAITMPRRCTVLGEKKLFSKKNPLRAIASGKRVNSAAVRYTLYNILYNIVVFDECCMSLACLRNTHSRLRICALFVMCASPISPHDIIRRVY